MSSSGPSGRPAELDPQQQAMAVYGSLVDRREAERLEKLTVGLSDAAPPWAAPYIKQAAPAVGLAGAIVEVMGPIVYNFYASLYRVYQTLPTNAASCLWGLALCFFGGRYPLSLAAVEAFKLAGGDSMMMHLVTLRDSAVKVQQASQEDDKHDADGDGVADVRQMGARQLFSRKMALVLRSIDPGVVSEAVGGLWSGYLGVLAALKLRYARTAALAHSIGDAVRPAASKLFGPSVLAVTPPDYRNWVGPAFNLACKVLGLTIAWRLQHAISTVQSGLTGGLQASRAALALMGRASDDTMADEVAGWALAATGIYYQFLGGGLPAVLVPVLWPAGLLERWLAWSVTFAGGGKAA